MPHLEKLGKAPQTCPQRPLIFLADNKTVYSAVYLCMMPKSVGAVFIDGHFIDGLGYYLI